MSHKEKSNHENQTESWLHKISAALGIACAVHCLLSPLMIATLPLLGLAFLADEQIEIYFVVGVTAVTLPSAIWGYKKHRDFPWFIRILILLSLYIFCEVGLPESTISHFASGLSALGLGLLQIQSLKKFHHHEHNSSPVPPQR